MLTLPQTKAPARDPVLLAVAGPERGTEFPLARDRVQQIGDRFTISWDEGVYVAKSLTEKEIMVGGDLVTESIVNSGDVIITETGEYQLRGASAVARGTNAFRAGIAALAAVAFAVLAWPVLHRAKPAPETAPPVAATSVPAPPRPPDRLLAPVPAPQDNTSRIALARLRFALAEDYARQSSMNLGFLFWAIEEWKQIDRDVSGIVPPPEIIQRARERRVVAEKELEQKKKVLQDGAVIAFWRGDLASSEDALHQLITVTQNRRDPLYVWATDKINMVHARQASQARGAGRGLVLP